MDGNTPLPTLHDIISARRHVYRHLKPTPLIHYPTLMDQLRTILGQSVA